MSTLFVLLGISANDQIRAISEHSPGPALVSLPLHQIYLFLMFHTPHPFDKLIFHQEYMAGKA